MLQFELPRVENQFLAIAETDDCAVDGIVAAKGCHISVDASRSRSRRVGGGSGIGLTIGCGLADAQVGTGSTYIFTMKSQLMFSSSF